MPFSVSLPRSIDILLPTRLLQTSLTTIALAASCAATAQSNSGSGSWQLYSTSIHRVLAVYSDFDACRQAANLGRDLACSPVEAATNTTPTPPVMQPLAVKPPV